jgi:hypothetical protein
MKSFAQPKFTLREMGFASRSARGTQQIHYDTYP